jgi:hypothetical protein
LSSSFRFDVGILGTVIVRILVLACSIGVLVEIIVVVAVVVATVVGAIFSVLGRASASIQSVRVLGTRWEQTGNVHKTEVRECALRLSGVVRGVGHGWDDEASLKEVGSVPDPEGRAQERDDVPGAHPQEDRVLDRRRGGVGERRRSDPTSCGWVSG